MDPKDLISQLNDPRLRNKIQSLANTPQGRDILNKLQSTDKNALLQQIQSLNNSRISSEMLLRKINSNPDLLNQISDFLSKQR
jgi:hypothetical protein